MLSFRLTIDWVQGQPRADSFEPIGSGARPVSLSVVLTPPPPPAVLATASAPATPRPPPTLGHENCTVDGCGTAATAAATVAVPTPSVPSASTAAAAASCCDPPPEAPRELRLFELNLFATKQAMQPQSSRREFAVSRAVLFEAPTTGAAGGVSLPTTPLHQQHHHSLPLLSPRTPVTPTPYTPQSNGSSESSGAPFTPLLLGAAAPSSAVPGLLALPLLPVRPVATPTGSGSGCAKRVGWSETYASSVVKRNSRVTGSSSSSSTTEATAAEAIGGSAEDALFACERVAFRWDRDGAETASKYPLIWVPKGATTSGGTSSAAPADSAGQCRISSGEHSYFKVVRGQSYFLSFWLAGSSSASATDAVTAAAAASAAAARVRQYLESGWTFRMFLNVKKTQSATDVVIKRFPHAQFTVAWSELTADHTAPAPAAVTASAAVPTTPVAVSAALKPATVLPPLPPLAGFVAPPSPAPPLPLLPAAPALLVATAPAPVLNTAVTANQLATASGPAATAAGAPSNPVAPPHEQALLLHALDAWHSERSRAQQPPALTATSGKSPVLRAMALQQLLQSLGLPPALASKVASTAVAPAASSTAAASSASLPPLPLLDGVDVAAGADSLDVLGDEATMEHGATAGGGGVDFDVSGATDAVATRVAYPLPHALSAPASPSRPAGAGGGGGSTSPFVHRTPLSPFTAATAAAPGAPSVTLLTTGSAASPSVAAAAPVIPCGVHQHQHHHHRSRQRVRRCGASSRTTVCHRRSTCDGGGDEAANPRPSKRVCTTVVADETATAAAIIASLTSSATATAAAQNSTASLASTPLPALASAAGSATSAASASSTTTNSPCAAARAYLPVCTSASGPGGTAVWSICTAGARAGPTAALALPKHVHTHDHHHHPVHRHHAHSHSHSHHSHAHRACGHVTIATPSVTPLTAMSSAPAVAVLSTATAAPSAQVPAPPPIVQQPSPPSQQQQPSSLSTTPLPTVMMVPSSWTVASAAGESSPPTVTMCVMPPVGLSADTCSVTFGAHTLTATTAAAAGGSNAPAGLQVSSTPHADFVRFVVPPPPPVPSAVAEPKATVVGTPHPDCAAAHEPVLSSSSSRRRRPARVAVSLRHSARGVLWNGAFTYAFGTALLPNTPGDGDDDDGTRCDSSNGGDGSNNGGGGACLPHCDGKNQARRRSRCDSSASSSASSGSDDEPSGAVACRDC